MSPIVEKPIIKNGTTNNGKVEQNGEAGGKNGAATNGQNGDLDLTEKLLDEEGEEWTSEIPPPPDGGWGWVVVFASFMIHVIADGITYSFGIFMTELIDEFKAARGESGLIPSILVGVTLGSGPIASLFTNRYGCRIVTIAGAILAAAGLAASALATNITYLYFTIGVCTGLGFGLIYLPAIVSVSMYFEKKRAFATGIAVCGSGFGTFIFAPVSVGLIKAVGWKYALLVTACIVLLNIFFGALFRPPRPVNSKVKLSLSTQSEDKVLIERNGNLKSPTNTITPIERRARRILFAPLAEEPAEINQMVQETQSLQELQVNGEAVTAIRPFAEQMGMNGKYNDMARMAMSHPAFLNEADTRPKIHFGSHAQFQAIKRKSEVNLDGTGVMNRKDILYGGSLLNIPEYKQDPQGYRKSMNVLMDPAGGEEGLQSSSDNKICCFPASPKQAKAFRQMLDLSLLKDPIFMMYAASNFLTSIGFNVPYVFTPDRARLWGISEEEASYLLSVIGIANTVGRIILGWLSDRPWINRLYMYNTCLVVCGVSMALSTFMSTYALQVVYCAIFGVTSGAYVGLTSVVLVDLLGLDKLTNAFGLLLMFQGIASVLGPPIVGALYDSFQNYDAGFYMAGFMIFLSGAMLFAIPWIQRRRQTKPKFKIVQSKSQDDITKDDS